MYETLMLAKGVSKIVGGIFGKRSADKKAKQARLIARYNSQIALKEAEQKAEAINFKGRQLIKQQNKFLADEKMNIAARGGSISGGDQSLILENIALENLNVKNTEDLTLIAGENKAQNILFQGAMKAKAYKQAGKESFFSGVLGALDVGTDFFSQSYKPKFNPKGDK